jgi:hypothetical protein
MAMIEATKMEYEILREELTQRLQIATKFSDFLLALIRFDQTLLSSVLRVRSSPVNEATAP